MVYPLSIATTTDTPRIFIKSYTSQYSYDRDDNHDFKKSKGSVVHKKIINILLSPVTEW